MEQSAKIKKKSWLFLYAQFRFNLHLLWRLESKNKKNSKKLLKTTKTPNCTLNRARITFRAARNFRYSD